MLFTHDLFTPERVPHLGACSVLRTAADMAPSQMQSLDILDAAIRTNDPDVVRVLSASIRPGTTLEELSATITQARGILVPSIPGPRHRDSFAPNLLHAFDQFGSVLNGSGGVLNEVALPLLLHLVMVHLDPEERQLLTDLDTQRAAVLFRDQVLQRMQATDDGADGNAAPSANPETASSDLDVPQPLIPWEDLTSQVQSAGGGEGEYPYDGDPQWDRLFDGIARVLHRRQVNHVLLTGERGVGTSTLMVELARRAATGQISFLKDKRFLRVLARHIPPDESRQRLAAFLSHVIHRSDLVIAVEGFASLLRDERGFGNRSVLLSGLSQSRCRWIGLMTPREYDECIADDPDFAEFFARIEVEEPDVETALKLMRHYAGGLEHRYGITVDPKAVREAVVLSSHYILHDHLPGKALKLLHAACEEIDYERNQLGSMRDHVTPDDMVRAVSATSGVPEETLRGIADRSDYEESLRGVIFGQDHAIHEVAMELGLIKAGMTEPTKPASVMLFLGQTGTGKTEMAKALARFYSRSQRLKVYALGNCVEPHSVSTLIGVPPGYVGTDQGGRLVNELNADPYSVFLFDEADKAHPDVLQPLLNLFDEGWVNDQRGVKAYGNRSIFILTSNVGQRMITEMHKEGKSIDEITTRMKEALAQIRHPKADRPVFPPEFLARLKRVIVFRPLDAVAMTGIARKAVSEMEQTWQIKRGKVLVIPADLTEYLGEQAYHLNERSSGKEGGRIVRKLLAEWIEAPLQREITHQIAAYQVSHTVLVDWPRPDPGREGEPSHPPEVRVRFE